MKPITYITADALQTEPNERVIIPHICNDQGSWGAGFVLAVRARFPAAERAYRTWSTPKAAQRPNDPPFRLGETQFIFFKNGVTIANMIGQTLGWKNNQPPIRYAALRHCLATVRAEALRQGARVQMPRIGAGLAGGDWDRIAAIITEELCAYDLDVTVCDLAPTDRVPAGARVLRKGAR